MVTGQAAGSKDGDGPVKRRELLTGTASLAGANMIAAPVAPRAASTLGADPRAANLLALLAAQDPATSAPVPSLERSTAAARAAFSACRYHVLSQRLPRLIARLDASTELAGTLAQREQLLRLTADAYCLASELCVKLGEDAIAWVTADRAIGAARRSGDPVTFAAAARRLSIAMRRHGHHQAAVAVLTGTALDLGAGNGGAPARELAVYATLLSTAAYTAAKAGHRHHALELITEAGEAASRLPAGTAGFDAAYVSQYHVGVHTCLGDPATALAHAAKLAPQTLPTPQRRSRFCIDTALAWLAFGKPANSLNALLAAEQFAPEEVCRPSVRAIVTDLFRASTPHPAELRAFAARCGTAPQDR